MTTLTNPHIAIDNLHSYDIQAIFDTQKKNVAVLKHSTAQERIAKLKKLEQLIISHQTAIEEALLKDLRKNATETYLTEILSVVAEIHHVIKHLKDWLKPQKIGQTLALFGTTAYIHHEPKGVALIISPWNYPFNLAINPLISAIAAGCCVLLKPSELSPATSAVIKKIVSELAPENEIAVLEGGVEVSTALLALPFDHIFFTGSPAIGKVVMKAAAEHLTSVTLELGGKSPAIVDETADLQDTVEKLVWGKFVNAGQTCIAPDYILVKQEVKEKFVELLSQQIEKVYNPEKIGVEKSDSLARIINERNFNRLVALLDDAVAKGATIAYGGQHIAAEKYLAPTLLTHVTTTMKVMQEEIFGTLLPIVSYKNSDEALQFIAEQQKPLAFYIFSRDNSKTEKYIQHSTAGGTCVNDCLIHISHPDLPFGGVNNSGMGRSHGLAGFLEFTNQRAVLKQRTGFTAIKLIYPPYTEKVKKIANFFMNLV
jgi:aldehyde dehydrogenase (NAD+)